MTEQVKILSSIDLQPKEIADIIGTDSATVSTLKSRIKNKSESKTQKIAVPPSEEKINGY